MSGTKKNYDLVSLGSCTMDMIFSVDDLKEIEFLSEEQAEKKYIAIECSSKLNVKSVKFFPGGSATNIACNLSNIGFKTAYIGGVGDDMYGKTCLQDMIKHKVDTSGVKVFPEDSTAISVILVNPWEKDRSILAYKGANNLFSEENVPENLILSSKCFAWTSLTSDKGIKAIKKCIKLAKSTNGIVVGAPSISIIKNRLEDTVDLMKKSEITSMNIEELKSLTEQSDVLEGMRTLFSWGLKIVNITFSKEGQWISDGKKVVKTTPPKTFPADTTGAGDATMSGVIYGILKGKSLETTSKIAVSLSAMEIEAVGVRVGTPIEFSELKDFMKKHDIQQEVTFL